ncbi:MAG: hypothetical protein FGF53_06330 [Candidatus Brockarchaeota archaeon]|nr:hypothetical protein [Candidatus Brockarchaeota archaeon]
MKVEIGVKQPLKQEITRVAKEVLNKIPSVDQEQIFKFPIYVTCGRSVPACCYDDKINSFIIKLPLSFMKIPKEKREYILAHEFAHIWVAIENMKLGIPFSPIISGLDENDVRDLLQLWGYNIPDEEVEALAVEALEAGVTYLSRP